MREFFLNTLKWLNSKLRCQKYVNSFHVCRCLHLVFRSSIRVSFLLEELVYSSVVGLVYFSIVLTDRERAATG